jgi:hypothetical protein
MHLCWSAHKLLRVCRASCLCVLPLSGLPGNAARHDATVQVCDMTCDLSKSMATIQEALMKVLDSMLKQVQRNHKLDSAELSLSNALTKNFDAAIRRQLAPIWNTVPHSTQCVVRDIRTVQSLLTYLLRFNCVSFLRYLQCLRAAAGPRTEWMLHSAASTVFQVCNHLHLMYAVISCGRSWVEVTGPSSGSVAAAVNVWKDFQSCHTSIFFTSASIPESSHTCKFALNLFAASACLFHGRWHTLD